MSNKITTYNEIFEQRVQKLLKQIKVLRKNKHSNKDKIKACLKEAKQLKKKIHKVNNAPSEIHEIVFSMDVLSEQTHTWHLPATVEPGMVGSLKSISTGLTISSIGSDGKDLTVRFTVNK